MDDPEVAIKQLLLTSPPNIKNLAHKILVAIACLAAPIASIIYQVIFNCMLLKVKGFRLWYKKLMIKKTVTSLVEKELKASKLNGDPLEACTQMVLRPVPRDKRHLFTQREILAKYYLYLNKDKVKAKILEAANKGNEVYDKFEDIDYGIAKENFTDEQYRQLDLLGYAGWVGKEFRNQPDGLHNVPFDEDFANKMINFLRDEMDTDEMDTDLSYLNFAGSCNAASYNKALARIITIISQSRRDNRMLVNMTALGEIADQLNEGENLSASAKGNIVSIIGYNVAIDLGFDVAKYGVAFSGAVLAIPVAILESFLRFIKSIIKIIFKNENFNHNEIKPKIAKAMASIFSNNDKILDNDGVPRTFLGNETWFKRAFSSSSAGGGRKRTKTKRRKNVKKKRKTTKRKTTKRKTTKRKTTKRKTLKKNRKLR